MIREKHTFSTSRRATLLIALLVTLFLRPVSLIAETPTFAEQYQALVQEELELQKKFQQVSGQATSERTSGTVDQFIERVQLASTPAEKKAVIEAWDAEVASLHEAYDSYNEKKFDFLISRYMHTVTEVSRDVQASDLYTEDQKAKIEASREKLAAQFDRYYENKGRLGKPDDRQRTMGMNDFLHEMQNFTVQAGKPNRSFTDGAVITGRKIRKNFNRLLAVGAALANTPRLISAYRNGDGKLMEKAKPFSRWLLGSQGKNMKVIGRENIPTSTPEGTLDIYMPMHAHNILDVAGVAELGLKKMAIMSAVRLPQKVGPLDTGKINDWSDFVIVRNSSKNPITPIAEKVESGAIQSMVLFPEAAMPGYGYETRPGQESLGLLLKLLQKGRGDFKGLKVRIIPVAFPRNAQFLEKYDISQHPIDSRNLTAVVGRPIDAETVRALTDLGDRQTLSRVVRQRWLEALDADPFGNRILGMPQFPELVEAMDGRMFDHTGCNDKYSALN